MLNALSVRNVAGSSCPITRESDRAVCAVEQAEHLYKEIRNENTLTDPDGKAEAETGRKD